MKALLKKLFVISFLVVTLSTGLGSVVNAQVNPLDPVCKDGGARAADSDFCKDAAEEDSNRTLAFGQNSVPYVIIQTLVFVVGGISVLMVVIGGFKYVVSAGDSNGIQGAKNTILYALVGLAVALFAQVIVSFVLSNFK